MCSSDLFRKYLLISIIAKRLKLQALSVDFLTARDLELNRKDSPSLHLGNNLNDVMIKFQSSRINDKKDIAQFSTETKLLITELNQRPDEKETFGKWAKETFQKYSSTDTLPYGLVADDFEKMNDITKEICGFNLIEPKSIKSLLGSD